MRLGLFCPGQSLKTPFFDFKVEVDALLVSNFISFDVE
jgi:hypothetical protein